VLGYVALQDARVDVQLRAFLTAPDARVALTAAVALARRHGERAPDRALALLAEAADHARPLPPDVPGRHGRALRGHVAQALARARR
jgi:hypothetical protein